MHYEKKMVVKPLPSLKQPIETLSAVLCEPNVLWEHDGLYIRILTSGPIAVWDKLPSAEDAYWLRNASFQCVFSAPTYRHQELRMWLEAIVYAPDILIERRDQEDHCLILETNKFFKVMES